MALETYHRKRNFSITPEPKGKMRGMLAQFVFSQRKRDRPDRDLSVEIGANRTTRPILWYLR